MNIDLNVRKDLELYSVVVLWWPGLRGSRPSSCPPECWDTDVSCHNDLIPHFSSLICMSVLSVYAWCPRRQEKGAVYPWNCT